MWKYAFISIFYNLEVFPIFIKMALNVFLQISLICQKLKNNMIQSAFIGNCCSKTNWICLIYQTLFELYIIYYKSYMNFISGSA